MPSGRPLQSTHPMQATLPSPSPASVLLQHPALWRGSALARMDSPGTPSGFAPLDAELPGGGWPSGVLTEIMSAHEGIGELRLLGPALAQLSREGKTIAWIAPPHTPYAPALAAAGIDLSRLLVVHTRSDRDALWAAEQALRAKACGAVLLWSPLNKTADYAALRRLQIAAEGGSGPAFVFRPAQAANTSSPAALRLRLDAADNTGGAMCGLAVHILKRRGAPLTRSLLIAATSAAERNHLTHLSRSSHALDRPAISALAAGDISPRHANA